MQGWMEVIGSDGVKLGLALLLGGVIGAEREASDKPAGLRTNMLICLGSTLMMILSIQVSRIEGVSTADPGRIAQGVITGIGFLGAGTILHSAGGVTGLTTAATTWAVAGIGLTLGTGHYALAILATGMTLATLWIFGRLAHGYGSGKTNHCSLRLIASRPDIDLGALFAYMKAEGINLLVLRSRKLRDGHCIEIECDAQRSGIPKLLGVLAALPDVRSARAQ